MCYQRSLVTPTFPHPASQQSRTRRANSALYSLGCCIKRVTYITHRWHAQTLLSWLATCVARRVVSKTASDLGPAMIEKGLRKGAQIQHKAWFER